MAPLIAICGIHICDIQDLRSLGTLGYQIDGLRDTKHALHKKLFPCENILLLSFANR